VDRATILLRDEELVDLIAASGGKWIFIGMESVDPKSCTGALWFLRACPATLALPDVVVGSVPMNRPP